MSLEGGSDSMFGRIVDLDIPPLEYYSLVRHFNDLIQTELSSELEKRFDWLGAAVTFATPGSDGRREKGSLASPLEIIALVDANVDVNIFENVIAQALREVSPTRISKIVEIKDSESKLAYFKGDPQRVQPGRIADSRFMVGDEKKVIEAKQKLGNEIVALPRKTIVERVEQLEKSGRQITERGFNRFGGTDAIHFDLETGTVYFNPEAHQLSFKVGPLRFVQNALLLEEIQHTRRENDPDFISTLHSSIVNRLTQLSDDRMLNITREAVDELKEHYAYFLRMYHRSEEEYVRQQKVAFQLTPQETEEASRRIQSLVELLKKFKIQKQPR